MNIKVTNWEGVTRTASSQIEGRDCSIEGAGSLSINYEGGERISNCVRVWPEGSCEEGSTVPGMST